jgi:broad specificity phosphatase PhoE
LPYGTRVADRGEPFEAFRKRIMSWWTRAMSEVLNEALPDGPALTVLVVSHGGFLRCLSQDLISNPDFHFTHLLNNDQLEMIPNTGVSKLELTGLYEGRLLSYGDIAHLEVLENNEEKIESSESNADALAL